MPKRVGLIVLNQFTAIGLAQPDGRVLPTREFTSFMSKIVGRVGGDSPDVTIINGGDDIIVGDTNEVHAWVSEMIAQEMTIQQRICCDSDSPLPEIVQPVPCARGPVLPLRTLTPVDESSYVYQCQAREAIHVDGSQITALQIERGPISLSIGLVSGGQIIELNEGDSVSMIYSTPPTITIIPR